MKNQHRFKKPVIITLSIITLAIIIGFLSSGATTIRGSTTDPSPYGLSTLRSILKQHHWHTSLWTRPPRSLDRMPPGIFVLINATTLQPEDYRALNRPTLLQWIRRGGVAVIGLNVVDLDACIGDATAMVLMSLAPDILPRPRIIYPNLSLLDVVRPARPSRLNDPDRPQFTVLAGELLPFKWSPPPGSHILLTSPDGQPVAVQFPHGKGMIVLLLTSTWLENRFLSDPALDNQKVILSWFQTLDARHRRPVLFDEFHHGFTEPTATRIQTPIETVYRRFWYYAFALFLLGLYRFTRQSAPSYPRPPEPLPPGVSFVYQIAGLMKRHRMESAARKALLTYLSRQVQHHHLRLTRQSEMKPLLENLLTRGQTLPLTDLARGTVRVLQALESPKSRLPEAHHE